MQTEKKKHNKTIFVLPHNPTRFGNTNLAKSTDFGRLYFYESNRNSKTDRRPRTRRDTEGDPTHHAYPRGRPVTELIDT